MPFSKSDGKKDCSFHYMQDTYKINSGQGECTTAWLHQAEERCLFHSDSTEWTGHLCEKCPGAIATMPVLPTSSRLWCQVMAVLTARQPLHERHNQTLFSSVVSPVLWQLWFSPFGVSFTIRTHWFLAVLSYMAKKALCSMEMQEVKRVKSVKRDKSDLHCLNRSRSLVPELCSPQDE